MTSIKTVEEIAAHAGSVFAAKYHCSEAIVIATGDYYLDPTPELLIRASCPFGGGVGGCREELCGLLSGAALILGALWGRTTSDEDDKWLYEVVCAYRDRFLAAFGETQCRPLRDRYADESTRCGPLVEEATRMLVALIEETAERLPDRAGALARRADA